MAKFIISSKQLKQIQKYFSEVLSLDQLLASPSLLLKIETLLDKLKEDELQQG